MAAGRLALAQYMPARDRQGRLVPGARMRVWQNKTNINAAVFAEEALTTPLTNPVIANSSGRFPEVWVEGGTLDVPIFYTLAFSASDGSTIGNPSVFDDVSTSVVYGSDVVADAEAAKEGAEIAWGEASNEAVNAGLARNAAVAAAATAVAATVNKADKTLGNLNADAADNWLTRRVTDDRPTKPLRTLLRDYDFTDELGCEFTGNPGFSDANTTLLRAAALRNAARGYGILRGRGTTVVNTTTPIVLSNGTGLDGEFKGKSITIQNQATTGDVFRLGNYSFVEGGQFLRAPGAAAHTAGSLFQANGVSDVRIEGVRVGGHYGLIEGRAATLSTNGELVIRNVIFDSPTPASLSFGSFAIWTDKLFSVLVEGCSTGTTSLLDQCTYGWRCGSGNTIMDLHNNLTQLGTSRYLDPDDELLQYVVVGGCADLGAANSFVAAPRTGGKIVLVRSIGCEMGNALGGDGALFNGTDGLIASVELIGHVGYHNTGYAVRVVGGVARSSTKGIGHFKMEGGSLSGSGADGLWLDNYAEKTTVRGLTSGEISGGFASAYYGGNAGWGVSGDASADKYDIEVFGTGNGSGLCALTDNGGTKRVVARTWA